MPEGRIKSGFPAPPEKIIKKNQKNLKKGVAFFGNLLYTIIRRKR